MVSMESASVEGGEPHTFLSTDQVQSSSYPGEASDKPRSKGISKNDDLLAQGKQVVIFKTN